MHVAAVLGLLIVLGCAALSAFALYETRRAALDEARTGAENLSLAVERGLAQSFESFALSIDGALRALDDGVLDGLPPKVQRLVLFDHAAEASGLGSIIVLDENGRIRFDSKSDEPRGGRFDDREHFIAQKERDVGLYISAPFVSRLDDAWSVALSRRINKPDGSFGGIVVGTIKLSSLQSLFESLATTGAGTTISLFRQDGVALVRFPFDPAEIGRNFGHVGVFQQLKKAPRGTFDQIAVRDGVARRYVYGRVGDMPLIFSIGLSFDDILANWLRKAQLLGALAVSLLVLMACLTHLLRRELSRRLAAETSAKASAARFMLLAANSNDAVIIRDVLGRRTFASPKFYEYLGRTPEAVGETGLQAFLHPDSRDIPSMTIRRLLRGERQVSELLQCIRPDGSTVWLDAVSRLVRLSDDEPSEILTNMRDVTDQKLLADTMARSKAELEQIAWSDPLTGIPNRRAFDDAYETEKARAARDGQPLTVLMIDVDHFKGYNDGLGHLAGDEALRLIAACVHASARRPADLAARFGGEEFVILLPGTDLHGGVEVAEALRHAILDLGLRHADGRLASASIGVAAMTSGAEMDPLAAADQALYLAKQSGRNCVRTLEASAAAA